MTAKKVKRYKVKDSFFDNKFESKLDPSDEKRRTARVAKVEYFHISIKGITHKLSKGEEVSPEVLNSLNDYQKKYYLTVI